MGIYSARSNHYQEMLDGLHKGEGRGQLYFLFKWHSFDTWESKVRQENILTASHRRSNRNYWHKAGWIQAFTSFTPNYVPTIKIMTETMTH